MNQVLRQVLQVYQRSAWRTLQGWIGIWILSTLWLVSQASGQGFLVPEDDSFQMPRHGLIRPPHRLPQPELRPSYRIRELMVDTTISGQIATTQVSQTFENTSDRQIAASFVFPIPYDGAVSEMTLMVDGKEFDAKILTAAEARKIYEGYVRRNQDPALLEWVGTGMFRTSVFPIPAKATRTVTLKYAQLLRQHNRLTDYLFPLSTARYTSQPLEKISLRVAIQAKEKIGNVYSPSHLIDVKRDDALNVVVTHQSSNQVPAADFRLVFDTAMDKVGVSLISYWPEQEDAGYFILLATPEIPQHADQVGQKTVIFVVDQSGSMSGTKIQQARDSAKFIVNNLREDDLFNIISYDSTVKALHPELQRFNQQTRTEAIGFVNSITAGGSTNIDQALKMALGLIQTEQTPAYIVFMTDGIPTVGETKELKIAASCLAANQHRARLISVGVGFDVNSRLLDRLSRDNNGQTEYVRPDEDLESATARLYSKISAPVLARVNIDYQIDGWQVSDGKMVDQLYPPQVTDIFAGGQVTVVGRYRKSGKASIDLTGEINGKQEKYRFETEFAAKGSKGPANDLKFVAQLWASRRIGEIIDLIDLEGRNDELIDELVSLSKQYGILTPYTAFLADDQAQPGDLAGREQMNRLTHRNFYSLENTSGSQGFAERSGKQFFKDNAIASSNFQNQQMAGRFSQPEISVGQGAGLAGGIGIPDSGVVPMSNVSPGGPGGGMRGLQAGQSSLRPGAAGFNGLRGIRQAGSTTVYVRGKTLVADNALEVDLEKDRQSIVSIKRFSDAYFSLVTDNSADENLIFSQQQAGEELLVRLRGVNYLIE